MFLNEDFWKVKSNMEEGRSKERVLFSNDGLIFVTYDHCETFAEIIGEEY